MKTNREKLIAIRDKHGLNRPQIATILGVSVHTVNNWFNPPPSKNHSNIHDNMLRLLTFELEK